MLNFYRDCYIYSTKVKKYSSIMQTSITRFFKAKQQIEADGNKLDDSPANESRLMENTAKRPADSDSEVRGDMKRQAVGSSMKATPVKCGEKSHKDDGENPSSKNDDTEKVKLDLKENTKVANVTPLSPLIDVNVMIRKKISSGAYALHENIGSTWFRALQSEFDKPYFKKLSNFVQQQRKANTVYPSENNVYTWTHHHAIKDTRVIILGQDPYHGPGQAHGLSFSVQDGVRVPPSLINIYTELENDIPGFKAPKSGNLTGWAKQGVLMLNTCLTVTQGRANSHQNQGWETFTDAVISWISKNLPHKVVFMLWGRPAQRKVSMINKRHKILTAAHPSPLSAHNGFHGCAHFSQTNSFLKSQGLPEIDWKDL